MSDALTAATRRSDALRRGATRKPLLGAGTFGFGFSALVDVLVLHHVLQWHHLLSGRYAMDTVAGLRANILADGLFSLGMLTVVLAGAGLVLYRASVRTGTDSTGDQP